MSAPGKPKPGLRRFYKDATVAPAPGGFGLRLDGRVLRTPGKAELIAPTRALAEAVAEEWRSQGATVEPATMPMTQLLNTAIERVPPRRAEIAAEIAAYAETDLVCFRAAGPPDLVARQDAAWDPLLDWLAERHGARLTATRALTATQPAASLGALRALIDAQPDVPLSGLHFATGVCGSLVIGLALAQGRLDAAGAFAAAQLDELAQMERWGRDEEAVRRLERIRDDIGAAERFLILARD